MNITESIATDIGGSIQVILGNTPEIQVYANSNINQYQWCDRRFRKTSDQWNNKSYDTRLEIKDMLINHIYSTLQLRLVPHEIAKKLQNFKFNIRCEYVYQDEKIVNVLHQRINEDHNSFVTNQRGNNWDYVEKGYLTDLKDITDVGGSYSGDILAPDLPTVQMWLREVHNLHINITKQYECKTTPATFMGWSLYIAGETFEENLKINEKLVSMTFRSYDDALEWGIDLCLTSIKIK